MGTARLNLSSSLDAIAPSPTVTGKITGVAGSSINVGGLGTPTTFTTSADAMVDNINIFTGGTLRLSNGALWEANIGGFNNAGVVNLASGTDHSAMVGNFRNQGRVDISGNQTGQSITIQGDYVGAGGTVAVNTVWNEDGTPNGASLTDQFIVQGNATGKTRVMALNAGVEGISGDIVPGERLSAPVVAVLGDVAAEAFYGYAPTAHAEEAQLIMNDGRDTNGASTFSWVLHNDQGSILSPDIPGYVTVAYANIEMLRDSIGTYRDRRGVEAIKTVSTDNATPKEFWGRVWNRNMHGHGTQRLDWKSRSTGYQIGYELDSHVNGGATASTNVYASYIAGDGNAYDRLRSESALVTADKHAGHMKTHNVNLGITRTYINAQQGYKDLVFQLSGLKNKYDSKRGTSASNHGWGATASFEQGANYHLNHKWYVEPMYQLMVNYFSLKDFNDGFRDVSQGRHWDALFRAGGRLYYRDPSNAQPDNLLFVKAYYVRDFENNGKAQIGRSNITEKNAKQWAEVGVGFQINSAKNTYFFMDAGIDRNLGGAYRRSYNVNAGISHKW